MNRWTAIATGVAASLTFIASAHAGSPGLGLVSQCEDDLDAVVADYEASADDYVADVTAKLIMWDDRGASDEVLTALANKYIQKVTKLEDKCIRVSNKVAQRCMTKLVRLDEGGLISQLTDVDDARDTAIVDIAADSDTAEAAIQAALTTELND